MMSSVFAAGVLGVDHEQVESSDTRPKTKMSGLAGPRCGRCPAACRCRREIPHSRVSDHLDRQRSVRRTRRLSYRQQFRRLRRTKTLGPWCSSPGSVARPIRSVFPDALGQQQIAPNWVRIFDRTQQTPHRGSNRQAWRAKGDPPVRPTGPSQHRALAPSGPLGRGPGRRRLRNHSPGDEMVDQRNCAGGEVF